MQEGSILPQGRTTGWMVPAALRSRWNLQLGDTYKLLPELLASIGHVDLFLHDSDHSPVHGRPPSRCAFGGEALVSMHMIERWQGR